MQTLRILAATACILAASCGKKEDGGGGEEPDPTPAAPADATATAAETPPDATAAVDAPAPVDAAPPDAEKKAEPEPMKLELLPAKWNRKRVKDYMKQKIAKPLGVECDFCHDTKDFGADSKKKKVALDMMKMTRDINKRFFKGKDEVSCYTCHLGNEEPPK